MDSVYHDKTKQNLSIMSIKHNNIVWLPRSSWDIKEQNFYLSERSKKFTFNFCLADHKLAENRKNGIERDTWVSCHSEGSPQLWAETTKTQTKFTKVEILVGGESYRSRSNIEAIELLISSQLLAHSVDILEVRACDKHIENVLDLALSDLPKKLLWHPSGCLHDPNPRATGEYSRLYSFSSVEWFSQDRRQSIGHSLAYLKKRSARIKRQNDNRPAESIRNGVRAGLFRNLMKKVFFSHLLKDQGDK